MRTALIVLTLIGSMLLRRRGIRLRPGAGPPHVPHSPDTVHTPDGKKIRGGRTIHPPAHGLGSATRNAKAALAKGRAKRGVTPLRKSADKRTPPRPRGRFAPKFGPLDAHNRATGVTVVLKEGQFTGHPTRPTRANGIPPGYDPALHHKGHLLGAQFGGSNSDPANFIPLHKSANTPGMSTIENKIRAEIKNGAEVTYSVTPKYTGSNPVPDSVHVRAVDQNGRVIVDQVVPNVP